ncbi:MAG: extracellular solute-binding protein [Roseburia sp.]|nr:extracellular solute-binding protein [Roseburia sp.]MCM1096457.1 extracellular solute-binding protein [Ruminococcus flavefaciens]
MMKKWMGRGLALGLAAAVTLGFCACGGKGKSMENAEMAKENVFRLSPIEISGLQKEAEENVDTSTNIMYSRRIGDRIYLMVCTNTWGMVDDIYGSTTEYVLYNMDLTGGDQKRTEINVPDEGLQGGVKEDPGDIAIPEEAEEEIGDEAEPGDGTESEGEPMPLDETENGDTEAPAENEEETEVSTEDGFISDLDKDVYDNVSVYVYYDHFILNSEGALYGIKTCNREQYTEEGYSSQMTYFLCRWGEDGNILWEKEVTSADSNEWNYIDTMAPLPDGGLLILFRGDTNTRVIVDAEGNASPREKLSDELESVFYSVERTLVKDDGTLFVIYHDENDWQKTYCVDYDLTTDRLGEPMELPSSIIYSWDYNIMNLRANGDLLFSTSGGIYVYTPGEEESRPFMNYINSDVYISSLYALVEISEDSFLAVYIEDWESGTEAGLFTYVDPATIQDKAVIVLAGQYVDYQMKKRAIEFNRESEDYRIVVKEYNVYNNYEDYSAGITRLNNDIITGNMPDILVNTEYNPLPIENYIAKGFIADINKLIEADEELSQKEFAQNVFDAYSQDGKLYYIVPNFEVYTMIAKQSLVGDRTTWTMDDLQQVVAGMGEEATAFGKDTTKEGFMNMVMRYCGNQFIDVATGKCSFNSEDFIRMMEFTKDLPEEINYDEDYWMNYDWSKEQAQYRENRTLLMQANLYDFSDFARTLKGYFGEPVSFVGFPTEEGSGAYLMSNQTYALAARSKNLDGAWQFMRYYLTDEYQEKVSYFPVNLEILREKSKDAMERPYWLNEDGEKEYYDQTIYINGEDIPIDPLTQEELDQVMDYILSLSTHYYTNDFVSNIVSEEMGAFYSGQKSAADVADVIQRRAQVYVDENR